MAAVITDDVTHVASMNDTMLRFLSKEGCNGYPTITVILNRMFINHDDFEWFNNSGLSGLPAPAVGDEIHWYKSLSLRQNYNWAFPQSVLCNLNIFTQNISNETVKNAKRFFKSKTVNYVMTSDNLYSVSNDLKTVTSVYEPGGIVTFDNTIFDVLSYGGADFFLSSNTVYKIKTSDNNAKLKIFYKNNNANFKAMCLCGDALILASGNDNTSVRLSGLSGDNGSYHIIRRETTTIANPSATPADSSSGGAGAGADSGGASETITVDNGVPTSCNFCWTVGSDYYIGNSTTSGKFPGSATNFIPTSEVDRTAYLKSDGSTRHYEGEPYLVIDGKLEFKGVKYAEAKVNALFTFGNFVYLATDSGINIYANKVMGDYGPEAKYGTFANCKPNSFIKFGDAFYIVDNGVVKRSYMGTDNENPIKLYPSSFIYEKNQKDESIDIAEIKMDIIDLVNLGDPSDTTTQAKIKLSSGKPVTFMVVTSKLASGKNSYHLIGNDDRNKATKELAECCNAFDIGV